MALLPCGVLPILVGKIEMPAGFLRAKGPCPRWSDFLPQSGGKAPVRSLFRSPFDSPRPKILSFLQVTIFPCARTNVKQFILPWTCMKVNVMAPRPGLQSVDLGEQMAKYTSLIVGMGL